LKNPSVAGWRGQPKKHLLRPFVEVAVTLVGRVAGREVQTVFGFDSAIQRDGSRFEPPDEFARFESA
jgi:hypothetical protein